MLRYRHLASVTLGVTDLDRARAFYAKLPGLALVQDDCAEPVRLRVGDDAATLELVAGPQPGLRRFGFEMESVGALDELEQALSRTAVPWTRDDRGLRIAEPHTGTQVAFAAPTALEPPARDGTVAGFGHVVVRTPEYRAAVAFWRDVLGFRLSDEIDGRISLLRCFPNPNHHALGIASGARRSFHHLNFRLHPDTRPEAIVPALAAAGVRIASGPGVHTPSGNRFVYFFDPDGLTLEMATMTERFVEGHERAPRILPDRPESFAQGDVRRHPDMYAVGEIIAPASSP